MILGKASQRCPNLAPNFQESPQIFEEYWEELENVSFEQVFFNMKEHSRNSDYFPTIAVLCKERVVSTYEIDADRLEQRLLALGEAEKTAVPPPKAILERWGKKHE